SDEEHEQEEEDRAELEEEAREVTAGLVAEAAAVRVLLGGIEAGEAVADEEDVQVEPDLAREERRRNAVADRGVGARREDRRTDGVEDGRWAAGERVRRHERVRAAAELPHVGGRRRFLVARLGHRGQDLAVPSDLHDRALRALLETDVVVEDREAAETRPDD